MNKILTTTDEYISTGRWAYRVKPGEVVGHARCRTVPDFLRGTLRMELPGERAVREANVRSQREARRASRKERANIKLYQGQP